MQVAFIGRSLGSYTDAAVASGFARFKPEDLVAPQDINEVDPNNLLIVTTGSQVRCACMLFLSCVCLRYMLMLTHPHTRMLGIPAAAK